VRISSRDAGPGFASLRHLARLTPELARLDPTLVRSLGQSFSSHSVVAAVAACATDIEARVIAPGVESREQLHELRNLGVELVQGPIVWDSIPISELRAQYRLWGKPLVKLLTPEADDQREGAAPSSISVPEGGAP
jgi:EAL domain-containing protein (putative c-di-GMP-specific phosphodiesterase class I)